MSRGKRNYLVVATAAVLILAAESVAASHAGVLQGRDRLSSNSQPTATGSLTGVRIVSSRPDVGGYDRSCKRGHGCVFGPAWSDDTSAPMSHDGCDTRSNVLHRDLKDLRFKPGTHDCSVLSGVLTDPYTAQQVSYVRGGSNAHGVDIDHVYPERLAWDMGAAAWPLAKRETLANDPRNLLAVSASANRSKGDESAGQWISHINNRAGRCRYVDAFVSVARIYGLPILKADLAAIETTHCISKG